MRKSCLIVVEPVAAPTVISVALANALIVVTFALKMLKLVLEVRTASTRVG